MFVWFGQYPTSSEYLIFFFNQDLKQTEAINLLQAQLINMTQLVSNLSSTVTELKREVKTLIMQKTVSYKWEYELVYRYCCRLQWKYLGMLIITK